jgi:2-polyprenyl-3-methyl-5-hydroxy-6-metoxy-1,4-benzoquinol methylase
MNVVTEIYNNNQYISNNPNLHTEDSLFKFNNLKKYLEKIEIFDNKIKILDVGGGAGILGKYVVTYFEDKNVIVKIDALDLSFEMLNIQKLNNPNISNRYNCSIEDFSESNYDLTLMIDVIEHIPNNVLAAEKLNRISKYIIYNIPIEFNFFDLLKSFLTLINNFSSLCYY